MFGATMAGDNKFFNEDGTSTMNSEGWIKGLTWVIDLYKNGLAPRTASTGASTRSSPASTAAPAPSSIRIRTR